LTEHESSIPEGLLRAVMETLEAQWGYSTTEFESKIRKHGLFMLCRYSDLIQQYGRMQGESNIGHGEHGHHPQYTLDGIWDGINRYSVLRGWGGVSNWREYQPTTNQTTSETEVQLPIGQI
jgi:hypothetical protein